MPSTAIDDWLHGATRPVKTIVFADLVESVRLMEEHEDQTIQRWLQLVARIEDELLPAHGGRLVKSTGDGVMLEFASARPAVQAALGLQAMMQDENAKFASAEPLALRVGAHTTTVVADAHDMYGKGVNLAARLMTLAGPHEIVVSPEVRDALTADLDADIEDLGECFVKHFAEPVRSYRVGAVGKFPIVPAHERAAAALAPTIAVIPFASRQADRETLAVGDLIADGIIDKLARSHDLRVISRLSTTGFRDRPSSAGEVDSRLGANYALSGSYVVTGGRVLVSAELSELRSNEVVWVERTSTSVDDLLQLESETCGIIAAKAHRHILDHEVKAAKTKPLPTLDSYSLLLGGINLMHRTSRTDFERSRALLDHLTERHKRLPTPYAWLAKWYVLFVTQGWADDPKRQTAYAQDLTHRALDLDADCSLALTIDGLVQSNLMRDMDKAKARHEAALAANPNESLAWLFLGTTHAFSDHGAEATEATERALQLSPLDPLRYFYDALAASAALTAGKYERAIELGDRSLKANRNHVSTYRTLTLAHALHGQIPQASEFAKRVLEFVPGFTVSSFLENTPGKAFGIAQRFADAFLAAGIPRK